MQIAEITDTDQQQMTDSIAAMEAASTLSVDTAEDETVAADFLSQVKRITKEIEEKRQDFVGPANAYVKKINSLFKPFTDRLAVVEDRVKRAMSAYRTRVAAAEAAERKRIQEENDKAMKVAAQAMKDGKPFEVPQLQSMAQTSNVAGSRGGAVYRTVKKWRVRDEALVPRSFLAIDDRKVTAAVKAGVEVPGIEAYEETEVAARAR
jgi:hypothetical protein